MLTSKKLLKVSSLFVVGMAYLLGAAKLRAQSALQLVYGARGVQTVSYNGVVLEDLNSYPSDAFHIWHMKSTDLRGNPLTVGQYGWGESASSKTWNPSAHSWTYIFNWGSIQVQYVQSGADLDMIVTTTNVAGSGIILDGAAIYPLALHLPQLPAGFYDAGYSHLAFNNQAPGVTVADYGAGEVAAVAPDASKPLYSGFVPTGSHIAYTPIMSGTSLDTLASFQPHFDRPVQPGQSDTYTVSLRFAPSGTSAAVLASDAYNNFAAVYPPTLHWADRRAIGTIYLASSPSGNLNQRGGFPTNPRRYFNDGNAGDVDITNAPGLARFQARILVQAQKNVANLRLMNAQGAITWDIEGEEYPQQTSYVCSPDQIATTAPEMETIITDKSSKYAGMKLDDAYFRTMTDAGFRVGVCVRPQHFAINADGTAQQTYLLSEQLAQEMIGKMQYAHARWGATLFYIDSTVDARGGVLAAQFFNKAAAALPDSLLIPEESTPLHFAYTAPFASFIDLGALGTPAFIYDVYPNAFSANLVNDASAVSLAASTAQLTRQVKQGDVLMAHADYWQANNPTIVNLYSAAGRTAPAPPVASPVPATITWGPPTSIRQGTALNATQLNAKANVAGNFNYTPVAGSFPRLGTNTLSVTFMPVDTTHYKITTASVLLTVNPLAGISPPSPPVTPVAPPVSSASTVVVTSPVAGAVLSGQIMVQAAVIVSLDAAGSYLMVDGEKVGTQRTFGPFVYTFDTTRFSNGRHTLQVWAHDTANSTWISSPVSIVIMNTAAATPAVPPAMPPVVSPVASLHLAIVYPAAGATLSGFLQVEGRCDLTLDPAGSYLMVDGNEIGKHRVTSAPYLYSLDTATLTPGPHTLQLWAHDVGNNTVLSGTVVVDIAR